MSNSKEYTVGMIRFASFNPEDYKNLSGYATILLGIIIILFLIPKAFKSASSEVDEDSNVQSTGNTPKKDEVLGSIMSPEGRRSSRTNKGKRTSG